MGIYLILIVSGQKNHLHAGVHQIKETHWRIFFIYFYEVICTLSLPILDKFLWWVVVLTVSSTKLCAEDELKIRQKGTEKGRE